MAIYLIQGLGAKKEDTAATAMARLVVLGNPCIYNISCVDLYILWLHNCMTGGACNAWIMNGYWEHWCLYKRTELLTCWCRIPACNDNNYARAITINFYGCTAIASYPLDKLFFFCFFFCWLLNKLCPKLCIQYNAHI